MKTIKNYKVTIFGVVFMALLLLIIPIGKSLEYKVHISEFNNYIEINDLKIGMKIKEIESIINTDYIKEYDYDQKFYRCDQTNLELIFSNHSKRHNDYRLTQIHVKEKPYSVYNFRVGDSIADISNYIRKERNYKKHMGDNTHVFEKGSIQLVFNSDEENKVTDYIIRLKDKNKW